MQWFQVVSWVVCFIGLLVNGQAKERVDINTATAEELDKTLVHVGPRKAEAIVAYRKDNGPFKSPDDLAGVKGISTKIIQLNRQVIDVGETMAPARKARHEPTIKPIE